jgi:hypothetical protein
MEAVVICLKAVDDLRADAVENHGNEIKISRLRVDLLVAYEGEILLLSVAGN